MGCSVEYEIQKSSKQLRNVSTLRGVIREVSRLFYFFFFIMVQWCVGKFNNNNNNRSLRPFRFQVVKKRRRVI